MNTKCRNCKKKKITPLFSLGNLSFTGKFANSKKENIQEPKIETKTEIEETKQEEIK